MIYCKWYLATTFAVSVLIQQTEFTVSWTIVLPDLKSFSSCSWSILTVAKSAWSKIVETDHSSRLASPVVPYIRFVYVCFLYIILSFLFFLCFLNYYLYLIIQKLKISHVINDTSYTRKIDMDGDDLFHVLLMIKWWWCVCKLTRVFLANGIFMSKLAHKESALSSPCTTQMHFIQRVFVLINTFWNMQYLGVKKWYVHKKMIWKHLEQCLALPQNFIKRMACNSGGYESC